MSVSDEYRLVRDSADFLKSKIPYTPQVGIILGTGLGHCVDQWKIDFEIRIKEIFNLGWINKTNEPHSTLREEFTAMLTAKVFC
jgi:purine nucleoside phosphorylase